MLSKSVRFKQLLTNKKNSLELMKTNSVVRLICVTALFYCLVQIYHNYRIRLDKEHLYHVMSDIGINMDGKLCSIPQIFLSIKSVSPKTQYQLCILKFKKRAKIQKTKVLVSGEAFSPAWFFLRISKSSEAEKINFKVSFAISYIC